MMERIARKMRGEDEGFTLIELMVVVLIIGILVAIALPTFLGARTRAQNRAAQSSIRNSLSAAKTVFTDNDNYSGATSAGLQPVEPSLTFNDGATASTGQNIVSVAPGNISVGDNMKWGAAVLSDSKTCYIIVDFASAPATGTAGTKYGTATAANCTANYALANLTGTSPSTPTAAGW